MNKIADLQYMFDGCTNLIYIDELKYLNTKYCNNFECMFYRCIDGHHYQILKD